MYSNEDIWHGDKLKVGFFGVGEKDFRLPDGFDEVWVGQVHGLLQVRVRKPGVRPLLPEIRVSDIVLKESFKKKG